MKRINTPIPEIHLKNLYTLKVLLCLDNLTSKQINEYNSIQRINF